MSFISVEFVIFAAFAISMYFSLPLRFRNLFLLMASYYFYGRWNATYLLLILFSTTPGERVMLPEYGCELHTHVFDGSDNTTLTHIKSLIADAILFFEPRIKLEEIQLDTGRMPEGILQIILDYTVLTTNSRSNMVIPYYLTEGTNIRAI